VTASEFCDRVTKILDLKKSMIPEKEPSKGREGKGSQSNSVELAFKAGIYNIQMVSQANRSGFERSK